MLSLLASWRRKALVDRTHGLLILPQQLNNPIITAQYHNQYQCSRL
jgi:hypothetical protein